MKERLDVLINPEYIEISGEMTGLQGRLVLANQDYLNPYKEVTIDDADKITTFEERNYEPFEKVSAIDRYNYWKEDVKREGVNAVYERWRAGTTALFNNPGAVHIIHALEPLFKTIGIERETTQEQFAHNDVDNLYIRYFGESNAKDLRGVKQFVYDLISAYNIREVSDYATLTENMEHIGWFAHLFGDKSVSVPMICNLITAEIKLKTWPNFLQEITVTRENDQGKAVMRINDLKDEEIRILLCTQPDQSPPQPESPQILPIEEHKREIQEGVQNYDTVIIIAGTSSGKTIKTPPMIREIMGPNDMLFVTEPRQVNTSVLAGRIAQEAGVKLGEKIGFQHGAESKVSNKTNILFSTEGTLIQKLLNDPDFSKSCPSGKVYVMVDEAHVGSDLIEEEFLALKKAQKLRKENGLPPLIIIIASATIDEREYEQYFQDTKVKVLKIEGVRQHPITIHFSDRPIESDEMPQEAARVLSEKITKEGEGDVIIFVAGIAEINKTAEAVQALRLPDTRIIKLHAGSSEGEKREVEKDQLPGERRVFIATNFAETGITIKTLKFEINTGEEYEKAVNPATGFEHLRKIKQARAGCIQRAGRLGRTSPGTCYNLFKEEDYLTRQEYPTRELKRSDLTELVLRMKKRGIRDLSKVHFLSSPLEEKRIAYANKTLDILGALNPDGTLNDIGERMVQLPTEFHLARAIASAEKKGRGVREVCTIAALFEARNLFQRDEAKLQFRSTFSDFLTYLNVWEKFEQNGKSKEWAEQNGLNYPVLMKAEKSRQKLLHRARNISASPTSDEEMAKLIEDIEHSIFEGYRDRLMRYHPARRKYTWERQDVNSFDITIDGRKSTLGNILEQYIVAGSTNPVHSRSNSFSVFDCQRVKSEWLYR